MSDAFYVGSIGLQSQQRALDMLANNIANMNTPAFKRADVRFNDLMTTRSADSIDVLRPDLADALPSGVTVDQVFMLEEQGEIDRTGRAMDVAIEGRGFIELMGADGRSVLWRGGSLKINEDGMLATTQGMPLRAAINVPQDATALQIGADGMVNAMTGDSAEAVQIGQIMLVSVDDLTSLERLDGGLYRVPEGETVTDAQAGEDGFGTIVQGGIERSTVKLTDEMVRMMLVQRAYTANAQMLQAADQMMGIANGLRR